MSILELPVTTLDGTPTDLSAIAAGKATLVVNVASKCGFTNQYEGLTRLQSTYADRGFTVLGVPCNQFGGQEPGTSEEIAEFCSATYGADFPMLAKADVNGDERHPLFAELTQAADVDGQSGDVHWNFEKFLLSPAGEVLGRWRTRTSPEDPAVVAAIEAALPQ